MEEIGVATINGTTGNDTKAGTSGNDIVNLYGGNDSATGGNGADTLYGGNGNDRLDGGLGNDRIEGGAGNDYGLGGNNDDRLYGQDGNDTLYGGEGVDAVNGDNGNDTIFGGNLNDSLTGGNDRDAVYGDGGDDRIAAGSGADTASGGNGNDLLYGGVDNDRLEGGAGADTLDGDAGDTLIGGAGADRLWGGRVLSWDDGGTAGVVVDLRYGTAKRAGEVDSIVGLQEVIIAGQSNDRVIVKDVILAVDYDRDEYQRLDHTIYGGNGDDFLSDAYGEDTIFGGNGADMIRCAGVRETDAYPHDTADGGAGSDTIYVGAYSFAYGGAGDDAITGAVAGSSTFGGTGNDWIRLTAGPYQDPDFQFQAYGGANDDYLIVEGTATGVLSGDDGDDTLESRNGILHGGNGDDSLDSANAVAGGAGNDILHLSRGNSFAASPAGTAAYGGTGSDVFVIQHDDAAEFIETAPYIGDFNRLEGDYINLENVLVVSGSAFMWIGAETPTEPGELGYYYNGTTTVIRGIIGGGYSEMPANEVTIVIQGNLVPDEAWFVL